MCPVTFADRKAFSTSPPLDGNEDAWRSLGTKANLLKERRPLMMPATLYLIQQRCSWAITNVHLVKAMVFPVVMYGCESWIIKNSRCWRMDSFGLWCWRRLLRVPCTARRSNQSILKEISPEYSLEGLMLKLKLQSFGAWFKEVTNWKRPWGWKRLKAGGEGDDREWDGWMASLTWWTWVWVNSGSWWWTGRPGGSDYKGSPCNAGDLGFIPGLGRSPGGGHGNPLQYSCLENPHGQRSLAGYSPWGLRVGHDWATKHSVYLLITNC